MQATQLIWHNGILTPWNEAKIHVLTHTLHYGSGVFEGIRVYKTDQGNAIFCLDEHIDRFFFSTQVLKMTLPYSKEELKLAILETVKANQLTQDGYIRPLAFHGTGPLLILPTQHEIEVIIACLLLGKYLNDKVKVKTSSFIRIHPKSTNVEAKISGHYVNSTLALLELKGTHYDEALLLDDDGYICEGSSENFFLVKDKIIYTPALGSVLAGITRKLIIELAQYLGLKVVETKLTLEDAYSADEAFFTGTAAEVSSIGELDDKIIGDPNHTPITDLLGLKFSEIIRGKNKDFEHLLTYVK